VDELRFKIDAFRPDTIPMARLAEYMANLAALLGSEKSVHFVRLDAGCVELVHRVDAEDMPKVDARISAVQRGDGALDAIRAFRHLDDMLANDNATGHLANGAESVVLQFPGKTRKTPIEYGAFAQQGSFDGIPVKVGGLKEEVSIHLQETGPEALVHTCTADRGIAHAIAAHIFESVIRVHGSGRWKREANGTWTLARFIIRDFELLDDAPLTDVVAKLRAVPSNGWCDIDHPLAVLRDLRGDEDSVH